MIDLWSYSQRLRRSFCRATSELPEDWTPERPSIGQCHVSALLLERAYGGDVLEGCTFAGQYHYWNLIDGVTVDLTRDQFPRDVVMLKVRRAAAPLQITQDKAALLLRLTWT